MDYRRIYTELIHRAAIRPYPPLYPYERHHITPLCLSGPDIPANIVLLSTREHYFAHLLLARIHLQTRPTLLFAAEAFFEPSRRNSLFKVRRQPRWLRQRITVLESTLRREKRKRHSESMDPSATRGLPRFAFLSGWHGSLNNINTIPRSRRI